MPGRKIMEFLGWDGVKSTEDLEMVGVYFVQDELCKDLGRE